MELVIRLALLAKGQLLDRHFGEAKQHINSIRIFNMCHPACRELKQKYKI